ncbi:MAG: Transcriptional regulator, TetR family [Acidobacteriaceae bacterium]|jgi:AcrR family transcriptional regulator|nr:Transcriptional regulator, TetR family [Acidobacteriaceae bacterium]
MHAVQKNKDVLVDEEPPSPQESGTLRERKHEFVLREIEHAAWDLFGVVGFDRATVEEISRNAGVSRRTFFRYFRTKEDVLSYSVQRFGKRVAERFAILPSSRKPLAAIEEAFLSVSREDIEHARKPKEMLALMFNEPCLRGRFLFGLDLWVPALSAELVRRKAYRGDVARCDLAAALYCTAFDRAHVRWYRDGSGDLPAQLKRAFRQLHEMESASLTR